MWDRYDPRSSGDRCRDDFGDRSRGSRGVINERDPRDGRLWIVGRDSRGPCRIGCPDAGNPMDCSSNVGNEVVAR